MHKRCRPLLILAFVVVAGGAYAQGFGFGMGSDDLYPGKGTGIVPPSHVLLLVGGGDILLVGGGGIECVGNC